ncbi:MAG: TrmH family RNA methyltransferase [Bacteroidota bacterium]
MTISKNQVRFLKSLAEKKHRDREHLYLAEGEKIAEELLHHHLSGKLSAVHFFAYPEWIRVHQTDLERSGCAFTEAEASLLQQASSLSTPPGVMVVVRIPKEEPDHSLIKSDIVPVFEAIRDPGNLGTIIRTADWFGVRQIICSPDSVDPYNPKCIQSSMGAIARVKVVSEPLEPLISQAARAGIPVYGTLLDGEDLYSVPLSPGGLILFGNESKGLSDSLRSLVTKKIRIPEYPRGEVSTESLNIATSAGIILAEWRRKG